MLCFVVPTTAQESPPKKSQFEKRQERRLKKQMNKSRRGDEAKSNRAKLREANYKARARQGDRAKTTDPAGRTVRTKGTDSSPTKGRAVYSQPNPYAGRRLQKTDRAATANRRIVSASPRSSQNAWRGDIAGKRINASRSVSSSARNSNVYPQKGPFVNNPSRQPATQSRFASNQSQLKRLRGQQSQARSVGTTRKITPRSGSSASGAKNIYPQRGPFVNNPSPRPSTNPRVFSNAWQLKSIRSSSSQSGPPGGRKKIVPRSSTASSGKRNIFSQRGPMVNNPSTSPAGKPRMYSNAGQLKNIRSTSSQSGPPGGRKKIVPRSSTASATGRNLFSQRGPMVNNPSTSPAGKPRMYSNAGQLKNIRSSSSQSGPPGGRKKIVPRSSTASATGRNLFSQRGPMVRNPSPLPRSTENASSNKSKLTRLKGLQSQPTPTTVRKVVPRSASASFIVRRKINPYLGKFSKGEKAFTKDVAGRPLRQRNYESPKLDFIPSTDPYADRKKMGDQAYKGSMKSGYKSATRTTPQAWQGDITGRKLRILKPRDTQIAGTSMYSRKPGSVSKTGDQPYKGSALSGVIKVSPKPTEGQAGVAIKTKAPTGMAKGMANYQGSMKARKQTTGGGSISGSWNNDGKAIAVKKPTGSAARVDIYRGEIRSSSTSYTDQGGAFSGNIKMKKPEKGGGSISGSWNNDGKAIESKKPSKSALQAGNFSGNTKMKDLKPSMQKQGGDYTGNIKVKKPVTDDPAARWQGDKKYGEMITGFNESYNFYRGTLRQPAYVKHPNSADGALKVMKPNKGINAVAGLQVKTKLPTNYARKPHASSDALKGIQASKYQKDGSAYKGFMTQPKYVANPNSHNGALRVVAPSKVNYRMADYQGNMKMQRNKTPNLHPDARFAHSGKSNTPEGRDTVTGIKLIWAKLFQKNSTVPNHLKEKVERPRYDKREIGLWYD